MLPRPRFAAGCWAEDVETEKSRPLRDKKLPVLVRDTGDRWPALLSWSPVRASVRKRNLHHISGSWTGGRQKAKCGVVVQRNCRRQPETSPLDLRTTEGSRRRTVRQSSRRGSGWIDVYPTIAGRILEGHLDRRATATRVRLVSERARFRRVMSRRPRFCSGVPKRWRHSRHPNATSEWRPKPF